VGDILSTRKITFLVYGEDGRGKTSLIKSLDCKPEEILLVAADPGQLALKPVPAEVIKARGLPEYLGRDFTGVSCLSPKTGEEFREAADYIKKEAHKRFKWVIIDGLDEVGKDVLRLKMDKERSLGSKGNVQRAYGEMADAMEAYIGLIIDAPMSSIFITHIDENENSDIQYGPSFPGKKMKDALGPIFDEIFCYRICRKTPDSPKMERLLQCTPNTDPRYKSKDRSGALDDFELPDLGRILRKVFLTEEK
jgi:hypothetical protein